MGALSNDIILGKGLGELYFGMNRADVRNILGDPDEIENYEYPDTGEMAESWHYDHQEISLTFFEEEADWQLETISISSDQYVLSGTSLVGMSKEDVLKKIQDLQLGEYTMEEIEGDPEQSFIHLDDHNAILWMDCEEVAEVQWEPLWEE